MRIRELKEDRHGWQRWRLGRPLGVEMELERMTGLLVQQQGASKIMKIIGENFVRNIVQIQSLRSGKIKMDHAEQF